jgi:hypothetical protein
MLQTHQTSGAGTICQFMAGVPSRLSLIPTQELKKMFFPLISYFFDSESHFFHVFIFL